MAKAGTVAIEAPSTSAVVIKRLVFIEILLGPDNEAIRCGECRKWIKRFMASKVCGGPWRLDPAPATVYGAALMNHRALGGSGLKVSEICLGTMTFGYQCDEPTSFAILDRAAELGVDFLDTADCYPVPLTLETAGR